MRYLGASILILVAAGIALLALLTRTSDQEQIENPNLMMEAYPQYAEGGYADKRTVFQGDEITFFVANQLSPFSATVLRIHELNGSEVMLEVEGMRGNDPRRPCSAAEGCDWRPTHTLRIPDNWPSGWYRLAFPVALSPDLRYVDFVVAERRPSSDVLFIFDTQTAQAYNVYGGGSLYGTFGSDGAWSGNPKASKVSWQRPVLRSHTYAVEAQSIDPPQRDPHTEEKVRIWLNQRFSVAHVSNDALEHLDPGYVAAYTTVVVVGTQEYWSNKQIKVLEQYVLGGGRLYLSAIEFAYGAIRYVEGEDAFVYFNDPRLDPLISSQPSEVATVRAAVTDLERFFGASLEAGQGLDASEEFSDLVVVAPGHWAFEGLGYTYGDPLAGVRGLGIGAQVEEVEGAYCIVALPCDQVTVLALAPYRALRDSSHAVLDERIDGRRDHILAEMPETTYAVVALVRQGAGEIFLGPGGWLNGTHPHNTDPRALKMIEQVLTTFINR